MLTYVDYSLLTSQEGKDGKRDSIYKITETHVIFGDGCVDGPDEESRNAGDVCTCTFIGKRDSPK